MDLSGKKTAGIIVAAGLSSRMGDFKPFLELGGRKLIEWTIGSLRKGGIRDIFVVVGYRADEMINFLGALNVNCVLNESYQSTHMLDSLKICLSRLEGFEQFFLLPCDIPLVNPCSIKALMDYKRNTGSMVVIPAYKGAKGHPPLIDMKCRDDILNYTGEGGLKQILKMYSKQTSILELPDPAVLMDADTPEDFEKLKEYFRSVL
jgi:molybdenum cofactor cytidylyltransferase